jgi:flagellar FliJ protein
MKAFRFSLQSVLKLRQEQEQAAERALATVRRMLVEADKLCEDAQRELRQTWVHSRNVMCGGAAVCQFEQARRYAASVQENIKALEVKRRQAAESVEKAWARLRTARQKREILEKVRGRRLKLHRLMENAWEQRETDDRSTAAYAREHSSNLAEAR